MWKVYDKTGTKVRCEVRKVQYSGTFMGECFVNTTLHSELPIEFEIGDYFIYRNEQFTINYDPSVLKKAGARKSGEAYVYDGVKFNSFSDELTRCDFLDYVLEDNFIHFSALPTFSFFASSIKDLGDRIQANLNRIYTGDQKWTVEVHSEYVNTTNVNIDVSKIKVWGALEFINSKFNANFIIRGRKIIIGTAGVAIDNVFQYGKGNGLVEIQRVADSNQQIVTRLRVYGSERNIPVRYYNLPKIVDVKISSSGWGVDYGYWIQFNVAYSEERFSHNTEFTCSGRNIKGSWKHHNQYGEILEIEHEDYLFINNGKHKAVTKFISGAKLAAFPPENVFIPNLPNNMAVRNLMLPDFPKLTNDPYLDSENISSLGIREGSVFFDGSTEGLEEIYPSMEGITAQQLIDAGISCDVDSGDNGNLDEIFTDATDKDGKIISDDGKWDELKEGANIPPFNLTLKDIGFDINDYLTGETATISMKDGMCGGREFEITKCLKKGNKYVLTCNRVYDDGVKLYFPYKDYNIKAGDKFVLLHIEMPEVYISAASQRLLKAGKEYLAKNDYVRYTYEVKIDEIYMARHPKLYNILKEGDLMLFTEPDFHIDGSIIIDSLRITEGEGIIPTFEVTLADEKQVGTIDKIQNVIDSVVNGQGSGGYNSQQINSLIKSFGKKIFLSKVEKDTAAEVIGFEKGVEFGNYTPGSLGSGGVIKVLPNGQTYVEVDELYVRMKAMFDSLTIKELRSVGGEILLTLAGIECTKVELIDYEELYDSDGARLVDSEGNYLLGSLDSPAYYRCFFTADDGNKAIINQFAVGDFAQCRQFDIMPGIYEGVSNRYYWRYVAAVGDNYIDLSIDDCMEGSDIPQAGDKIVQLGNRTDPARQNAILLSAYGLMAPTIQMLQGIDAYSLDGKAVKEEGFDQMTQQFYSNIFGRSYVGERDRSSYLEYIPGKGVMARCTMMGISDDGQSVYELRPDGTCFFGITDPVTGKQTGIIQGVNCMVAGARRSGVFAVVNDEVVFELDPISKKYKFAGDINATNGNIGGWSITDEGIESQEISQSGWGGEGVSRTVLKKDGTITGNLLNVSLNSGRIRSALYDSPILEWTERSLKSHSIFATPFELISAIHQPGGTATGGDTSYFTGNIFRTNCLIVEPSYNPSFSSSIINRYNKNSIVYYRLPANLDDFSGVTFRIFNPEFRTNNWLPCTAVLIYNINLSDSDYWRDINGKTNFLGNYTGDVLSIPPGKMAVITGVREQVTGGIYSDNVLKWYVEITP